MCMSVCMWTCVRVWMHDCHSSLLPSRSLESNSCSQAWRQAPSPLSHLVCSKERWSSVSRNYWCRKQKDAPSSCQPLQRLWQNEGVFVVMVKTLLWGWSQFNPLTLSGPLNHSPVSSLFLFALNSRAASTQLSIGSKTPRQCPEATAAPARQSLFRLTRGEGPVSISQHGPRQLAVEGRLIWTM